MSGHIFISYSQKDRPWLKKLLPILRQAKNQGNLDFWSDEQIRPSEDWNNEIAAALENSTAAIILVSGEFLSSKFIKEEEVAAFLKKSIPIFPLLVSDCLWAKADWLQRLQLFPNNPVSPLDKEPPSKQTQLLLQFVTILIETLQRKTSIRSTLPIKANPHVIDVTEQAPSLASSIVLNVDVRNFTLMQPEVQHQSITALWKAIEVYFPSGQGTKLIPHEDGAVFIFPAPDIRHKTVMDFTSSLIKSVHSNDVQLRAALHQGYVSEIKSQLLKNNESIIFGNVINDCRKLCTFSDQGHYVISQTFLDEWDKIGGVSFDGLIPSRGKPPIKVMLKEDRYLEIRIAGPNDGEPPQKIVFLKKVDVEIWLILEYVEDLFVNELRKVGLKDARIATSPRISFLTPVRKHGKFFLTCSLRYADGVRMNSPSSTYYEIEPPGTGTCGRSFVAEKIQIAAGLPKNQTAYRKHWKNEWNLDEDDVIRFSRKSRAVLSIPIGITPKLGVLCVDSLHPLIGLHQVDEAWLLKLCNEIYEECNTELSALWMHRIQH